MLYACVERFDVMGERENILGWDGEVNKAIYACVPTWTESTRVVQIARARPAQKHAADS
jgi:hypothetical protein